MRKHLKLLLLVSSTIPLATRTPAQTPVPRAVRAAADRISTARIRSDIDYLASDALRGRGTFSPGLDTAAQFIVRRLQKAHLQPFGENGTYLEYFALVGGTPDTSAMFLEVGDHRLGFGDVLLNPFVKAIDTTTSVVFVGDGVRIPSKNIDAYAGLDLRGKLVLALQALPKGISPNSLPADFEGPRITPARLGAAGTILVPVKPLLDNWSGIRSSPVWTFAELDPPAPTMIPLITTILVHPETARTLLAANPEKVDGIFNRAPGAEFPRPFELNQKVRAYIPGSRSRRTTYNIVAMIKGSDPTLSNEYVTVAAHLDGAVWSPLIPGDTVFNAADDNATGSAGILAVAEQMIRAPHPRRSVVFIWDTGHEIGLFGSQEFVASGIVPLRNIVAHFNVDMIGGTAAPADTSSMLTKAHEVFVVGPRVLSTSLDSLLERTNRGYLQLRLNHALDDPGSEFYYPRTDTKPFIEHGIPTIDFFTGIHARYHRSNDEARYVDMTKVQEVSRAVMASVWAVANDPRRPQLDKGIPARVRRVQ
jgi:hypothetical protein